jgi:hypothetical protein
MVPPRGVGLLEIAAGFRLGLGVGMVDGVLVVMPAMGVALLVVTAVLEVVVAGVVTPPTSV